MSKEKISTDGGRGLGQNPFAALSGAGLPRPLETGVPDTGNRRPEPGDTETKPEIGDRNPEAQNPGRAEGNRKPETEQSGSIRHRKSRGRVDIRREKGGRGGKTVTVIDGFVGIGQPEKEQLARKIRAACGCGGTVKDGAIEIQGDQRETISRILSEAGFRPVWAGG
jgi:translation initiation factor 1